MTSAPSLKILKQSTISCHVHFFWWSCSGSWTRNHDLWNEVVHVKVASVIQEHLDGQFSDPIAS